MSGWSNILFEGLCPCKPIIVLCVFRGCPKQNYISITTQLVS